MRTSRIATARNVTVAIVAVLAIAASVIFYSAGDGATPSVTGKDRLTVGVSADLPGLGARKADGTFEGFDIDVATYIAGKLGVGKDSLWFRTASPGGWEKALREGAVDMVVAAYPITPERTGKVTFGGPYYVAHQDIVVRERDETVKSVRDLRGKRLCQVAGSDSWRRVTQERKVAATLVPARSYAECLQELAKNRVDAVSADDLALAGLLGASDSGARLVNAPFSNERYGVGLRKGDLEGCQAVNRIITEMYQNGAAETLLGERFGAVDIELATAVPQFEGCA
ncbi:transporter substrate-binding domain-containing protein [Actinomadura sp. 9N407]|uniref:transporter substrate-binding domain-containing protein n=1 Tax=Actinomadura sp. 9N407 TaxID=3375154 RepID=UPI003792AB9F